MRSIPSEKIFSLLPRWRFNWGWMGIDKSCTKAEKSLQKLSFDCYNKSSLSLTLSLALFLFPGRKKKHSKKEEKNFPSQFVNTLTVAIECRGRIFTRKFCEKKGRNKSSSLLSTTGRKSTFPELFSFLFSFHQTFHTENFSLLRGIFSSAFFSHFDRNSFAKKKGEKKASDTKKIVEVCGNALSIRCG